MFETIKEVIKNGLTKINPIKTSVALGCLFMMGYLSHALVYVAIPENNLQPVNLILGSVTTVIIGIANYYFGSSAGSKNKDEIIKQMNTPK